MDDLFNILSSSARIDKSKRKKNKRTRDAPPPLPSTLPSNNNNNNKVEDDPDNVPNTIKSRDRTGKRDTSIAKQTMMHREQMAAFRRSMHIRVLQKHDPHLPDPVSSFDQLAVPRWWAAVDDTIDTQTLQHHHHCLHAFHSLQRAILRNIEAGRWKEPTPIQMQTIPSLVQRRDVIGSAPTGSGKSGAFLIPCVLLSGAPNEAFYGTTMSTNNKNDKQRKDSSIHENKVKDRQGEIRSLILAPSLELASQLHREFDRLGSGKPGGVHSLLLAKNNAAQVIAGKSGGKRGLDVLISTPLRLVDAIQKGLSLNNVRMVVLDEADRLLDATDGKDKDGNEDKKIASGSMQSKSFLAQMDVILSQVPVTAVRGLFSATVTPMVRELSESILRNPVDITVAVTEGGANPDIEQELTFVGKEEGKLLAIRQLVQRGQLRPPVIIFLQSQERAQALFSELLYDGIHVDVIHAGRSKAAREDAVAKFRKGETWVLICTDLVARGVDFRAVNMVINYDLPTSGVTYVHRIGRTGRAGRKGTAITLFTEADFDDLRTIANVMKQSGCNVPAWMLNMKKRKNRGRQSPPRRRKPVDTTPSYDKKKRHKKQQMVANSKRQKRGGAK